MVRGATRFKPALGYKNKNFLMKHQEEQPASLFSDTGWITDILAL